MKIIISEYKPVDIEIDLFDFFNRFDCTLEFIDLENAYYIDYYTYDEYPSQNFIMIYQENYDGGLREIGYIICKNEPQDLIEYAKNHIEEFVLLN